MNSAPLVELQCVSKRYAKAPDAAERIAALLGSNARQQAVLAVDGVDLAVAHGEVLGLAGESGCGKSTLGRIAAGLLEPTRGTRRWRGRESGKLAAQMIFQDAYASLNPRMRVEDLIGEAPAVHGIVSPPQKRAYVAGLLDLVGLDAGAMRRFPHQFSGGQRSRVAVARALAVKPELLVCDEAVAALDVSIQAQVLNLFMSLRERLGLGYLFISHDLGVIRHVSDRVAIMYLGRIVESAPTAELYSAPNHPYTQGLLSCIPRLAPSAAERTRAFLPVQGEMPSPLAPPPGCHYHPRCPYVMPRCRTEPPKLLQIAPLRFSACHLNEVKP